MAKIVQDSQDKTKQDILTRYINEAPSDLQFTRRQDLEDLLKSIALRERTQDASARRQWTLLFDPTDPQDGNFNLQPRRGRRSHKRQRQHREQGEGNGSVVGNEDTVAVAIGLEQRFLDQLHWRRKFCQKIP